MEQSPAQEQPTSFTTFTNACIKLLEEGFWIGLALFVGWNLGIVPEFEVKEVSLVSCMIVGFVINYIFNRFNITHKTNMLILSNIYTEIITERMYIAKIAEMIFLNVRELDNDEDISNNASSSTGGNSNEKGEK